MSLTDLNKTMVTMVKIKLDYCEHTFNTGKCLFYPDPVPSTRCYNTFSTCVNKDAYSKIIKEYKFVDYDVSNSFTEAHPYLLSVDYAPTEIQDDRTVNARATLTFRDERDYDVGIDPYLDKRNPGNLNVEGYFFKKFIVRNPNYKGRIVEIWEGTADEQEEEFQLKDTLQIDNITVNGDRVKIECVDILKRLDEVQYPVQIDSKLDEDVGALYEVKSEEDMLKLNVEKGDYALRSDFLKLKGLKYEFKELKDIGKLPKGFYKYTVVAFKGSKIPVARASTRKFALENVEVDGRIVVHTNAILLTWESFTDASRYKIFYEYEKNATLIKGVINLGRATSYMHEKLSATPISEKLPPNSTPAGANSFVYETNDVPQDDGEDSDPLKSDRIFEFTGGKPDSLSNWIEITGQDPEFKIINPSALDSNGYLQINKEIVQYYVSGSSIKIPKRNLFGTKPTRHYKHTSVNKVYQKYPTNPFSLLLEMLKDAGIPEEHIDMLTFTPLKDGWNGIKFSTKPITKQTKLSKLYFDLVNVLDGQSWRNEQGKITIRLHDKDEAAVKTITDAENIILNSTSIDRNEEERFTQVSLYWDRDDVAKSLSDKDNYNRTNINIDSDAESEEEYGERLKKELTTTWINIAYGQTYNTILSNYIKTLLKDKLQRFRNTRPELTFDVEGKDSTILLGSIVSLETDEFNDVNGKDFSGQRFQIIKKENKGSRVTLTAKLYENFTTAFISNPQESTRANNNQNPVISEDIDKEIEVFGLQYKASTGFWYSKVYGGITDVYDRIKLRWNNMYKSTEKNLKLIDGSSYTLDNTENWKKVYQYKIYMFTADVDSEEKVSEKGYPGLEDSNGNWKLIATVQDTKEKDPKYKYEFSYTLPIQLIGAFLNFYVSVTTKVKTQTPELEVEV